MAAGMRFVTLFTYLYDGVINFIILAGPIETITVIVYHRIVVKVSTYLQFQDTLSWEFLFCITYGESKFTHFCTAIAFKIMFLNYSDIQCNIFFSTALPVVALIVVFGLNLMKKIVKYWIDSLENNFSFLCYLNIPTHIYLL